jgi:glucokinase
MEQQSLVIGIDIGGTKIAAGLVDPVNGKILLQRRIPTRPERDGSAVLADTLALAHSLAEEAVNHNRRVAAIGVGLCELVDPGGTITSAHTLQWRGVAVHSMLAQIAPTILEADVRAHALAEARYGAGQPYRLFVFVTVGTGISSCLVQDGVPLAGARGNALVLASSPLSFTCAACGTLQKPILEEYASGPAILARYNQIASTPLATTEDVVYEADSSNAHARMVIETAGSALGVCIAWLVNVLDPEAVIIGGGLGSVGGIYWQHMEAAIRNHIWADTTRDLPILAAALGPDAGIIGAACAAVGYAGVDLW